MKGVTFVLLFLPFLVMADIVVPKSTVTSYVTIRAANSSISAKLGELHPGQSLRYAGSVSRWHKIELPNNQIGFVSKRWSEVHEDSPPYFGRSPFTVHFIDVGVGDATIIDIGEKEIIIDGGNYVNDLHNYAEQTGIIDGSIELVIVTHGDQDHWKGLSRLLGFDSKLDNPFDFEEYWDPGYNRDCNPPDDGGKVNYLNFVSQVKDALPADRFKRPLEDFYAPMDQSGTLSSFTIPSIPEAKFMLFHTQKNPTNSSCSYMINNASIVLMIEIDGVKMLFTGDANGKKRDDAGNVSPSHVEKTILDTAQNIGGDILKADLLKAPHHGSETASTEGFIDTVNPEFVIISASTFHHLPKPTVISRYINNNRTILRTDLDHDRMEDHIVCGKSTAGNFDCQYASDLTTN